MGVSLKAVGNKLPNCNHRISKPHFCCFPVFFHVQIEPKHINYFRSAMFENQPLAPHVFFRKRKQNVNFGTVLYESLVALFVRVTPGNSPPAQIRATFIRVASDWPQACFTWATCLLVFCFSVDSGHPSLETYIFVFCFSVDPGITRKPCKTHTFVSPHPPPPSIGGTSPQQVAP